MAMMVAYPRASGSTTMPYQTYRSQHDPHCLTLLGTAVNYLSEEALLLRQRQAPQPHYLRRCPVHLQYRQWVEMNPSSAVIFKRLMNKIRLVVLISYASRATYMIVYFEHSLAINATVCHRFIIYLPQDY
jgi:hypothetical protein